MNDFRFALRQMLKSPVFTGIAVLSLALGIGANATVLGWIDSALLHPVPGARDAGRLVVVAGRHASGTLNDTVSYPDLEDIGRASDTFDGVAASQFGTVALGVKGETDWVWGQITTANFFEVLGVRAALGRFFLPDEEVGRAGAAVAVISHGLWQRRFGGDPDILGRTIDVNRQAFTVVGVGPPEFRGTMGGLTFDIWLPLSQQRLVGLGEGEPDRRDGRWLHALARLRPGVSHGQAQAVADTVMRRLAGEYPNSNQNQGVALFPLWASPYGAQAIFLPLLRVMLGVTLLVFLLVVANVANLLLARASARAREMAVRLAVGASRGRIVRQLLTESLVLAAMGGSLGVLFAHWTRSLLFKLMPATYLPIGFDLHPGGIEITSLMVLTLAAGILFGLAPAWQSGRADLNTALKEGGRGDSGRAGRLRLRSGLVIAEVALALVLLVAAGLCMQSFERARHMDPGFDTDRVWLGGFRLGAHGFDKAASGRFFAQLRQRLRTASGVETAAFADWLPLGFEGGSTAAVKVEGYEPTPGEHVGVGVAHVSPDYFHALRIPLRDGRDFAETDDIKVPGVVVVNEAFVQRFLPGRRALGAKVNYWGHDATIVGVVATGHYRSLAEPAKPFLYASAWQDPSDNLTAVIRMKGGAAEGAAVLGREVARMDPAVKVWVGLSFADYTAAAFAIQRVAAQRLVLGQGIRLTLAGLLIGGVVGFGAARGLGSLLVGVRAADGLTWVVVPLALLGVALGATWLPARRAARVDPMVALRGE